MMAKVSNETRLIWNLAEERVARILRGEQAAHKKSRNYLKGLGAGSTLFRLWHFLRSLELTVQS
jgi:hypothetical protein